MQIDRIVPKEILSMRQEEQMWGLVVKSLEDTLVEDMAPIDVSGHQISEALLEDQLKGVQSQNNKAVQGKLAKVTRGLRRLTVSTTVKGRNTREMDIDEDTQAVSNQARGIGAVFVPPNLNSFTGVNLTGSPAFPQPNVFNGETVEKQLARINWERPVQNRNTGVNRESLQRESRVPTARAWRQVDKMRRQAPKLEIDERSTPGYKLASTVDKDDPIVKGTVDNGNLKQLFNGEWTTTL
jgi:hypothetical protein